MAEPNLVVSWPIEPGPNLAIIKPLALRYFCRAMTSAPIEPIERLRLKIYLGEVVEVAEELVPCVPVFDVEFAVGEEVLLF